MTEDDERIAHALHDLADRRTTTDAPGPLGSVGSVGPVGPVPVAELLRRGRRSRRLRTLTRTVTAAGAVALACTTGIALAPGGATTPTPAPPAAHSTSAPAPATSSPSPTATPATADQALDLLRSKLPGTLRLSLPWTAGPPPKGLPGAYRIAAAYTVTDGSRTGSVRIEIARAAPRTADPCPIPDCTVTALPDGSQLTVYLPTVGDLQDWRAELRRPDGTFITASAGNIPGPGDKRRDPYPNSPLLDGAQLTALAQDPVWHQLALTFPSY
ncbi:hypothetical protein ACGFX4_33340 [Kitasatospora sp. NPDC048365]|uniref:hypothetical protein n=1 Tax=Kitasatospora sp. NPDC048365 TaxID=3364050 RepID=UPI003713FECC